MKDEADLMENPVKFIEPGTDLLEFGVDKIEALKREIMIDTVGFDNIPTKEAINEKQQDAQFEGRKAKLNRIREQFDATRKFALETAARLRYGRYFVSSTIYGGQEYFLQTADDIANQYDNAKKVGLPAYEVARIRDSYTETRFKGNPAEKERAHILSQLMPYPDLTATELKTYGLDAKEPAKFLLKTDFITFITRFERENGNIVEFGSLIDFNLKLKVIEDRLYDYVNERVDKMVKPEPEKIPA